MSVTCILRDNSQKLFPQIDFYINQINIRCINESALYISLNIAGVLLEIQRFLIKNFKDKNNERTG